MDSKNKRKEFFVEEFCIFLLELDYYNDYGVFNFNVYLFGVLCLVKIWKCTDLYYYIY